MYPVLHHVVDVQAQDHQVSQHVVDGRVGLHAQGEKKKKAVFEIVEIIVHRIEN